MTIVYIVVAMLLAAFAIANLMDRGTSAVPPATDLPLSSDDFTLRSKGWSAPELARILSDFTEMYDLPADTFRTAQLENEVFEIEAARPISSAQLFFLVNYLHYPKDFDLTERNLTVAARFALTEAMGPPNELTGRQTTVYVPSGDTQFDEVYARVDPASYFRIPFANLHWMPTDTGREPKSVVQLMRERGH